MSATETSIQDYSTGVPRRHHSLYIEDGNLVFQVENAIFKVHRSFLTKCSTVIKDMVEAPQSGEKKQAIDEDPLVLTGDTAVGWALLLESHYESPSLMGEREVNYGERLLAILPIAHKYCMDMMEGSILKQFESVHSVAGHVDLLVASKIIDSKALYDKALNALIADSKKPTLDQARRIGLDAYFEVMNWSTRCRYNYPTCRNPYAGITRLCMGCQSPQ